MKERYLKRMRAGLILLYAGLISAIGMAVLVVGLIISAFSWSKQLLDKAVFGMTGLAILACALSFIGVTYMFVYWVKGLAMLNRGGLMKLMYIDIGVFVACIAIFILTGGTGLFILPMIWYLTHAGFMRKLDTEKQDLYSLGEIK